MYKLLISSIAAILLGVAEGVVADDADTHTVHTKTMKEAGHRDGEAMVNKAPEAQPSPPVPEDPKAKKHTAHTKAMKEAGHKDGDVMIDGDTADTAAAETAEPMDEKKSHRVHTKAMKEAGHKDGEPMKN